MMNSAWNREGRSFMANCRATVQQYTNTDPSTRQCFFEKCIYKLFELSVISKRIFSYSQPESIYLKKGCNL